MAHGTPDNGRDDGPHLAFFDVPDRRTLDRLLRAAAPQVRRHRRRSWSAPPRVRAGRVGVWFWKGDEEQLRVRASEVLLNFVHPLVASGRAYCVGFPFAPEVFAPRPLSFADLGRLDLEDIGTLLRAGPCVPAGRLPASAGAPPDVQLDPGQRAAVLHARGAARVLASAGAGKTKTLVSRVAELLARGVDPGAILLLAFNRKAAEQFEERLAALGIATTRRIGAGGAVHCATFNAFGARYQKVVAGTRATLDSDGGGARALMRRTMTAAGLGADVLKPTRGSDPVGDCLAALTRVRSGLEDDRNVELRLASCGEQPLVVVPFAPVHAEYTRLQAKDGRQSFDDQVYLALADLLAQPDHRAYIQGRYQHVLVDEFQDLNGAQLALVDLISRPRRDLFVVGDDDQLIYGWRFADIAGILGFHERLPPKPWSATYTLGTNYRSSREIVAAGGRLIAHNTRREVKEVQPRAGAPTGSLRVFAAGSWKERSAEICAFLRTEQSLAQCEWRELALLCRYRAQQLPVALALDLAGIPRAPLPGYRLFSHPAARLLRAYMDLVRAPHAASGDDLRLLVNRPNRCVRSAVVEAIAAAPRPWQRLLCLTASEDERDPLRRFAKRTEEMHRHVTGVPGAGAGAGTGADGGAGAATCLSATQLLCAVVDEFELETYWYERDARGGGSGGRHGDSPTDSPGTGPGGGALEALDALLLLAEGRDEIARFLAEWDRLLAEECAHAAMADDAVRAEQGAEDGVAIGTIHAAKGREYRSVVIPEYLVDLSRLERAQVEEERRVLYVGVTRAQHAALITCDLSLPEQPFLRELMATPDSGG